MITTKYNTKHSKASKHTLLSIYEILADDVRFETGTVFKAYLQEDGDEWDDEENGTDPDDRHFILVSTSTCGRVFRALLSPTMDWGYDMDDVIAYKDKTAGADPIKFLVATTMDVKVTLTAYTYNESGHNTNR